MSGSHSPTRTSAPSILCGPFRALIPAPFPSPILSPSLHRSEVANEQLVQARPGCRSVGSGKVRDIGDRGRATLLPAPDPLAGQSRPEGAAMAGGHSRHPPAKGPHARVKLRRRRCLCPKTPVAWRGPGLNLTRTTRSEVGASPAASLRHRLPRQPRQRLLPLAQINPRRLPLHRLLPLWEKSLPRT